MNPDVHRRREISTDMDTELLLVLSITFMIKKYNMSASQALTLTMCQV